MKAIELFKKLDKVMDSFSGGAVPFKSMAYFEHIKPSQPTIYHSKTFVEDGKEVKVIFFITESKRRAKSSGTAI